MALQLVWSDTKHHGESTYSHNGRIWEVPTLYTFCFMVADGAAYAYVLGTDKARRDTVELGK